MVGPIQKCSCEAVVLAGRCWVNTGLSDDTNEGYVPLKSPDVAPACFCLIGKARTCEVEHGLRVLY